MKNFYLSIPLFTFHSISPSFPIIVSPYHGYDNETYTTVRGMIEGMIAQNEGMMGMAGTSNTWKLMVCSLPSCCFVAMQRRQERL